MKRLTSLAIALSLTAAACSGSADTPGNSAPAVEATTTTALAAESTTSTAPAPETTTAAPVATPVEAVLETPCFTTAGSDLVLPEGYIAADVSRQAQCMFVTQLEGAADRTVIAGELWRSSVGDSYEEFVAFVEQGLSQGREPDIQALQILNSPGSGRDLPIIDRVEIDGPNRATIFLHESDRLGQRALSAVVDFDTAGDENTRAFLLWGRADDSINPQLIVDLINSMNMNLSYDE